MKDPKISYAIPVHNEYEEIDGLIKHLLKYKKEADEIVVQCDKGNTTENVYKVLDKYHNKIKIIEFPLNRDFASFKNNLKNNCTGDWVFQIDADEIPEEYLISMLPTILKQNPNTEVFWVPRINTVDGLTKEHIQKWGWNVNNRGWVNFPDKQLRIYKNDPERIKWTKPVHEQLKGYTKFANLPAEEKFCLYHPKNIGRQESQNAFYETI